MSIAVQLSADADLATFRSHVRRLLAADVEPADVVWTTADNASLFAEHFGPTERTIMVPRPFAALAEAVLCHRDGARWALLYQALWRIDQGERNLLDCLADPLVHRLHQLAASVRRDAHRMTAFVRFQQIDDDGSQRYVAWYEPQHYVVRLTSKFFIDRFATMRFSIMTPDATLLWDLAKPHFGPGVQRPDMAQGGTVEDCWKRYYAATFNPARSNPDLMKRHIPRRFWRDLPEAVEIPSLLNGAGRRTEKMIANDIIQE